MFTLNKDWKFESSPPPAVTAYTTTYNCLRGKYPVRDSIMSFAWCDKIVAVDGGSDDGTLEVLAELQKELDGKLSVIDMPIPMDMPGKDGHQKAMAYAMVDTPLAIQFDIDEVCVGDLSKWKTLLKEIPTNVDILSLPVFEPLGSKTAIRTNKEHTPWKWRVFRLKPEITHGIPKPDQLEIDGVKYSRGASDGCYPIHIVTEELYPSRMTKSAAEMTKLKSEGKLSDYESYLQSVIDDGTPAILHLGHVDLNMKIKHYLESWHYWWCHLYNKDPLDPKNNRYFPGVRVGEVTDKMIEDKVASLVRDTPTVTVSYDNTKQKSMGVESA